MAQDVLVAIQGYLRSTQARTCEAIRARARIATHQAALLPWREECGEKGLSLLGDEHCCAQHRGQDGLLHHARRHIADVVRQVRKEMRLLPRVYRRGTELLSCKRYHSLPVLAAKHTLELKVTKKGHNVEKFGHANTGGGRGGEKLAGQNAFQRGSNFGPRITERFGLLQYLRHRLFFEN